MEKHELPLREFISSTITDIINGVEDAQKNTVDTEAAIAPKVINASSEAHLKTNDGKLVNLVEFDVAITITKEKTNEKGIAVITGALGLAGKNKKEESSENLSRLKFAVPLALSRGDARDKIRASIK